MKKTKKIVIVFYIFILIFAFACQGQDNPPFEDDANKLELVASTDTIEVGTTFFIKPDIYDRDEVEWSLSNPDVLAIDEYYRITALKIGKCIVSCTLIDDNEVKGQIEIEVVKTKPVILANTSIISVNQSIMVFSSNYEESELTFSSLNTDIAIISNEGKLKGLKEGTAVIRASLKEDSSVYQEIEIRVVNNPRDVKDSLVLSLDEEKEEFRVGDIIKIKIANGNYLNYDWSTNKTSIATVVSQMGQSEGIVFANSEGIVNVYASKTDGSISGQYTFKVKAGSENSIDYVSRLIYVAHSQIGYVETGDNNTKYGAWYGLNNAAWCAMFVSWCAYHAGIPLDNGINEGIMPRYASVSVGMEWFIEHNCFHYKEDYTPVAGDIIIFKSAGASHTGIVVTCANGRVYTIEGNTSDMVKDRSYELSYEKITGYGHPNYPPFDGTPMVFNTDGSTDGADQKTD